MDEIIGLWSKKRERWWRGNIPPLGHTKISLTENLATGSWAYNVLIVPSKKLAGPDSEQYLTRMVLDILRGLFENLEREGHLIDKEQLSFEEIWNNGGTVCK